MSHTPIVTKRRPYRAQQLLAACLLTAAYPLTASANTLTYSGVDPSSFAAANSWTLGGNTSAGPPVNGDTANLGATAIPGLTSGNLDVTYNYTVTSLTSMTFDSTALPGAYIITSTGGTLGVTTETFNGANAANAYNLTQGSANTAVTLNIASASNAHVAYNVLGTGSTLTVTSNLWVGVDGTGTLTQSDGVVNVTNTSTGNSNLILGADSGATGTYNLTNGSLTVNDFQFAGGGNGIFNQSGGSLTVNANAFFSADGGQTAIYNFSGGTASFTNGLTVGSRGTFNLKTGGTLPFNITIGSGGTFNFAGGSFGAGSATLNSGATFNLASGSFNAGTVNVNSGATFNFTGGTFGTGTIALSGGTLQLQGHSITYSSSHITGTGTIQNGSATTASTLTISPATSDSFGGTIANGSTAALNVTLTTGTFTLSGTSTYSGTTTIQSGATFKASGSISLSGNSPVNLTGGTLDTQAFQNLILSLTGTSASTVNINSNGQLFVDSAGANTTYSGAFTGGGEFILNGSNTVTLSGSGATSTFTGFILVEGGTLAAGAADGIPTNYVELTAATASLSIPFNQHIATFTSDKFNPIILANSASLFVGSSNNNSSVGGNFSGTGTFVKNGTGNLTIGFGSTDTNANTGSSVAFTVNTGTLTLNKAAGTTAVAGNLLINGGTVILDASNQIASTSTADIEGGTLNLNGFNQTLDTLAGLTGSLNVSTGTLTVSQTSNSNYSGSLLGSGTFIKSPGGTLGLNNVASYTGAFSVTGGALNLDGTVAASSLSASNGAILQLFGSALTTPATVTAAGGSIVQLGAATLTVGAASSGASTITIGPGSASTFTTGSGLTTVNATGKINQSDGNFNLNGDLTVTAGSVTQTGGTFTWAAGHTMTIQSAANVTFAGYTQTSSNATINVTGANSQLNVSGTGSAYLVVNGGSSVSAKLGATIHSDLYFFIGDSSGSGSVTIDGSNSSITSSALASFGENSLGTIGSGSLTLSTSATGNVPNGFQLGNAAASSGTLSVLSSAALTTGPLDIGSVPSASTGTVNVTGGSITQSGNAILAIGASSLSTASLTIASAGTFSTGTGNITIGKTGSLTLQAGGTFNINGNLTNSGSLTLAGTQAWAASTTFTNNAGTAIFNTDAGSSTASPLSLTLNAGTLVLNNTQHLHSLTINGGTLGGYNSNALSLTIGTNPYTLAPSVTLPATSTGGMSLHTLTTSAKTTLAFNLQTPGNGGDKFTVFDFQGLTLNGGTIAIANSSTGAASLGYYKAILYISSIQGAGISSLTLPPVTNSIAYTLDTAHDNGYVDIHRGFLGDANDDGLVNFSDFVLLSNSFSKPNQGWTGGDFNNDGITNFSDFVILSNNFGHTATGANELSASEIAQFQSETANFGNPTSVPEPASLALLALAAPYLLKRKRK